MNGEWEKMYTIAYNNCLRRFFGSSKYCLTRDVYNGWLSLSTLGTLLRNDRINAFKNIVAYASYNDLVRFIFTVLMVVYIIRKCYLLDDV